MDEAGSSGSAEFEDFDDDELWRAEDKIIAWALIGSYWIIDICDITGNIWELGSCFPDAVEQQAGNVFFCPTSLPRCINSSLNLCGPSTFNKLSSSQYHLSRGPFK